MSEIEICGSEGLDKKYLARCLRTLNEWGAPLTGWYCIDVVDVREEDYEAELWTCELCGCDKVRFIHVMDNDLYFEPVRVGCICAGIMEGDILAAEERERQMRNRAGRRRNFLNHKWQHTARNVWYRTYRKQDLTIVDHDGRFAVHAGGKTALTYKGKPIRDLYSAIYAAFDLADPKEAYS